MNEYSNKSIEIFEEGYSRLKAYHEIMKQKSGLISYSGGNDSSVLLHFYNYLFFQKKIPRPGIFHLNHQIRNNHLQEIEIEDYLKNNFDFPLYIKKKIFRCFLKK